MKLSKLIVSTMVFAMVLTGCNKQQVEQEKPQETKETSERNDMPPMIMVNDTIYQDTGFVNSNITCGTYDGKLTTTVETGTVPKSNDSTNFGTGYGYQIGAEHIINVDIDGVWTIFKDVNHVFEKEPYVSNFEDVAYFDGTVMQEYDDKGALLVKVMDIPKKFTWIFNDVESLDAIKPIDVDFCTHIYPVADEYESDALVDHHIRVYFDGKLNHDALEMSNPMECNFVYCIQLLDD